MDIALIAPSSVPFAVGGAEHLWLGLQAYLNEETRNNCELFKFPGRGADLGEILESYLEAERNRFDYFDVLISGKDPAWFVEHRDHRIYMLHKLRGLYDTYHFFREPEQELPNGDVAAQRLAELDNLARKDAEPRVFRKYIETLLADIATGRIDEHDVRFPGPFARTVVHRLDDCALSPRRIRRYAAISQTVARRRDYFPAGAKVAIAYPPPRLTGFQTKKGEHFFTVSRLDSPKRVDLIIRAFREVKANVPLLIGGVGGALEDLKALAEGDDRIKFLGKLTDAEIIDHYARAIAVPFTPYDEDYGLITIEAMRSGKPVITLEDCGGTTEFVEHGKNGWCVPNDLQALTRAFEDALKSSERTAEMGRSGQERVRDITWENVAGALLADKLPSQIKTISIPEATKRGAKAHILVTSTFGIYPPRGGGQSRIFHLYSKLAEEYDVTAVCLVGTHEEFSDAIIAPNFREIRVPKSSAQEEAEAAQSAKVDWIPITDIVCSELLEMTPLFAATLRTLADDVDVVVASGPYLIDAIKKELPHHPVFYEAHNLELELKRDILPRSAAGERLLEVVKRVERRCWTESKLVFACAGRDISSLNQSYGESAAVQIEVPNGFSANETLFTGPTDRRQIARSLHPALRKSAVFLGSWHGPNLEAIRKIVEIAPTFNDVSFMLIGSGCLAFADKTFPPNVVSCGIVDEEEKALLLASCTVALNPMTEGSGSNLKMLDYFGAGIPVISSRFGARGINANPGEHYIWSEDERLPIVLSDFFSRLPDEREMVERAYKLAVGNYSWDVIGARFAEQLRDLLKDIRKVRLGS